MPNMKTKINIHNKQVLRENKPNSRKCNCIKKETCPMNGSCLEENILYIGNINCEDNSYRTHRYKGICETTFKKRYSNHKKSFNVIRYKHDTTLSTEFWKIKNKNPKVTWKIKSKHSPYNPESNRCNLCLNEKLAILEDEDEFLLNKRSEIISKCRHENKFMLKTLASKINYADVIT